jgi:dTDP-4-amino-4,6-dideoxygalactose transaminase
VLNNLKREGIETIRYFYPPIHKTRAYKEYNEISLERTEKLSQQILCLPMHPNLGNEQVNAVCRAIERAYAHSDKIMQRHVELSRKQRAAKEKRLAFQ